MLRPMIGQSRQLIYIKIGENILILFYQFASKIWFEKLLKIYKVCVPKVTLFWNLNSTWDKLDKNSRVNMEHIFVMQICTCQISSVATVAETQCNNKVYSLRAKGNEQSCSWCWNKMYWWRVLLQGFPLCNRGRIITSVNLNKSASGNSF